MSDKNYSEMNVVVLSGVMNAVAAAGAVDLAPVLNKSFVVVDGFVSTDVNGTTNNELTVGDAGDPNRYLDDVTIAAATLSGSPVLGTGKGFKSDGGANATVVATNTGSAATPSADITVSVTLYGYYDYT